MLTLLTNVPTTDMHAAHNALLMCTRNETVCENKHVSHLQVHVHACTHMELVYVSVGVNTLEAKTCEQLSYEEGEGGGRGN